MRLRISLERSILLISSIVYRMHEMPEDRDIFFRQSATRSLWTAASSVMAMIAFIGVRMSWLMAERNFAPDLHHHMFAPLVRQHVSSSARSIQTVLRFLSPPQILIYTAWYGTTNHIAPSASFIQTKLCGRMCFHLQYHNICNELQESL